MTPCLGEKGTLPVRGVMLLVRLADRLRLIPHVWRCKIGELRESMDAAGLVTIETEELVHSTSEYFVVAKKAVSAGDTVSGLYRCGIASETSTTRTPRAQGK